MLLNLMRKTSISIRITIWYAIFIALIMVLLIGGAARLAQYLNEAEHEYTLTSIVDEYAKYELEANDIEDDFRSYEKGVYMTVYYDDGRSNLGGVPTGFDSDVLPSFNQIQQYQSQDAQNYLYYDQRIPKSNAWLRGVVIMTESNHELAQLVHILGIAAPFVAIIIIGGGYLLIRRLLSPINQMVTSANQIANSASFDQRLPYPLAKDELYAMSHAFNGMLDTLEHSYQREKQFSANLSHELRTPIAVIKAESEYALQYPLSDTGYKESFDVILRQSTRMGDLVARMLELARLEEIKALEVVPIDMEQFVAEMASDYQLLATQRGVQFRYTVEANVQCQGDRLLLHHAIDNLLMNAMKFTNSYVSLEVKQVVKSIHIRVVDDGEGIPKEVVHRLWERFYQVSSDRNKQTNIGYGLGLAFVQTIAHLHNGTVIYQPNQPNGAIFQLSIPAS